ncbi:MAG: bifunctional serine/threonine-protein kinase/formylglycine-generating enzyme family protein [Chloroflexota bacterium]
MPLLPGEILHKRYRMVSLLAEGRYGAVYRAWDLREKVNVAVKEVLDTAADSQRRFRAEAHRLSDLKHPQLPAVRDHFSLDGSGLYLVSDYVDGVDLQSLLQQYGPLPSDLIVNWLQAVCAPLAYLHEKKQLHLNVKPANIRVTPAGQVFLVDTGLPGLGISMGASGYAAPEQQLQATVSPASDIYGLGATLYTLLTGQAPPDALRRQSGLETLKPAREVNPDVEPYLSAAAGRAMDLRPEVRYESVAAFARALERPAGKESLNPAGLPDLRGLAPRRTPPAQATPVPPPRLPARSRKTIELRIIWGLLTILVIVASTGLFLSQLDNNELLGGSEEAATATTQSELIAALTAIAPIPSPTPAPTEPPTPTPAPIISQTGARLLFMPAGIFTMGDDESEDEDAQPAHVIRLNSYFMDETEVTNGQYAQCVAAGVCNPPYSANATSHPAYYGDSAYDNYPVVMVKWIDAAAFCEWRGARLPTEAEWEKAAGFDPVNLLKLKYPWGDAFDGALVNFCDANCTLDRRNTEFNDGQRDTAPVATFAGGRSPIGLYDMAGNVMEWVNDWYDGRYYQEATEVNPLGPLEGQYKVLRGGSWLSSAGDLAVTRRAFYDPEVFRAHIGFRCALSPP